MVEKIQKAKAYYTQVVQAMQKKWCKFDLIYQTNFIVNFLLGSCYLFLLKISINYNTRWRFYSKYNDKIKVSSIFYCEKTAKKWKQEGQQQGNRRFRSKQIVRLYNKILVKNDQAIKQVRNPEFSSNSRRECNSLMLRAVARIFNISESNSGNFDKAERPKVNPIFLYWHVWLSPFEKIIQLQVWSRVSSY